MKFKFKSTILVLYLLFSTAVMFSQDDQKKIDSLLFVYSKVNEGRSTVETLYAISKLYQKISIEKSEYFNKKLLVVSKKYKSNIGIGLYHLNNSFLYQSKGGYKSSIESAVKAEAILSELDDKNYYLDVVYFHSFSLFFLNKQNDAFTLALRETLNPKNEKYHQQIAQLNYFLGYAYFSNEDSYNAIKHNLIALENYRKVKNKLGIIKCYYNITDIYIKTEQYDNAKEYAYKALLLLNTFKTPIKEMQSGLYGSLAELHLKLKQYNKAKRFLAKALKINEALQKPDYVALDLIISIDIAIAEGKYNSIEVLAKKILAISQTEYNRIKGNYYLGVYNNKKQKFAKAQYYCESAIKLINDDNKLAHRTAYKEAAFSEEMLHNYKKANFYLQKFYTLEQEYYQKEKANRVNELQTKFYVKEKNIELTKARILQEKKEVELQKQSNFLILLMLILLLTVIVMSILYWAHRNDVKKNRLLNIEKNKVVEALRDRELLLKEIHHRVKNNLQLVISMMSIQARRNPFNDLNQFVENSRVRITSMILIHQTLYEGESLEKINLQQYLKTLTDSIIESFDTTKRIVIQLETNTLKINLATSIPLGLIINEIVSNALKHAFPDGRKGVISIVLQPLTSNNYQLTIEDNGIGFCTSTSKKKSFGIDLINLLVSQLHGDIVVENLNKTKYTIRFQEIVDQ